MKTSLTGQQIRTARESAGLTQPQLAALVGLTSRSICAYETGAATIPARTALALRYVLGLLPKE